LESSSVRVLIVVSEAPPIVSGVSRCVDHLVQGLERAGNEVDVLSSNEIRRWSFGEVRLSSFLARWPSIRRRLNDYDVVNLHGPAPTMSDAFLALFRLGKPAHQPILVYTHHSDIDIDGVRPLCAAYNSITAQLARLPDRTVVSTPSYADLIRRSDDQDIEVVPWGVDARSGARQRRTNLGDPLRVLFVGQLRPYKGVPVLIEAIGGRSDVELTIVGDGPDGPGLRDRVAGASFHNITFAGKVSDAALHQMYADHDVITLPSTTRAEAFGLVLLEGMAAGCVPVASDLPGVRDVAGPTGVLVEPGSVDSLRSALAGLAADRDRLWHLGERSRTRAEQSPWSDVAPAYQRIFEDALGEKQVADWSRQLRDTVRPTSQHFPSLAKQFGASWWSFVLFDEAGEGRPMARLGRVATREFHARQPHVASFVARLGEPMLIGKDAPTALQPMLRRPEIHSAMAVPLDLTPALRGVISITSAGRAPRGYTSGDLDRLVQLMTT
jgi:glycosyltransferase involved in cell wall biosynthesis